MGGAMEMYRRSVEDFGQRVMAIGAGDWAQPTPCADWSVRDLVRHLVYEELWTPPLLAGATVADIGDRFEGDILGDDPQVAWKEAAAHALAAAGVFAPPVAVPADADVQSKLLAMTGRTP